MDSLKEGDTSNINVNKQKTLQSFLLRCGFTILFSLIASFFFSFSFGLIAITIGSNLSSFSSSSAEFPIFVASRCKIVSSGVDLRSSKVCELGFLNYKAKRVFYPLEKTRFRCRYDYYWASVFKVEYREYASGRTIRALAEAPKEALPLDCRPNFGTAWLMKARFRVNETYNCRYMPGTSVADIYSDDLFNCQAKDPSLVEMSRRFLHLFMKAFNSIYMEKGRGWRRILESAIGTLFGMLSSLFLVGTMKLLQRLRRAITRSWDDWRLRAAVYKTRFRRVCIFVAYISFMGWLTVQYSKFIGLREFLIGSYIGERRL